MNRALIGRQPIFRSDMHHILGYELLFRDSDHNAASFSNADQATAEVIVNSSTEIGLDKVVGPHLAFINFGRSLLLGSLCEAIPPERAVLEILENVLPDAELLQRLRQLRAKGYRIALDDFPCDDPINTALLAVADYVKLDLQANDWTRIEGAVAVLKKYPVQLIAEKVETPEQFQLCKRIGFDFFQGYFFCHPQVLTSARAPVNRLATIQLITKLNDPDIQFNKLESVICQDVSLSYKLLRY